MSVNTDFLTRCVKTLEAAFEQLQRHEPGDVSYDIFRAACVKEFEIILEQCGNLLTKRLRPFFASNRQRTASPSRTVSVMPSSMT